MLSIQRPGENQDYDSSLPNYFPVFALFVFVQIFDNWWLIIVVLGEGKTRAPGTKKATDVNFYCEPVVRYRLIPPQTGGGGRNVTCLSCWCEPGDLAPLAVRPSSLSSGASLGVGGEIPRYPSVSTWESSFLEAKSGLKETRLAGVNRSDPSSSIAC